MEEVAMGKDRFMSLEDGVVTSVDVREYDLSFQWKRGANAATHSVNKLLLSFLHCIYSTLVEVSVHMLVWLSPDTAVVALRGNITYLVHVSSELRSETLLFRSTKLTPYTLQLLPTDILLDKEALVACLIVEQRADLRDRDTSRLLDKQQIFALLEYSLISVLDGIVVNIDNWLLPSFRQELFRCEDFCSAWQWRR